jgi:hypothetical protein
MNCEFYGTVAADSSRSVSTTCCSLLKRIAQSARTLDVGSMRTQAVFRDNALEVGMVLA